MKILALTLGIGILVIFVYLFQVKYLEYKREQKIQLMKQVLPEGVGMHEDQFDDYISRHPELLKK